MTGVTQVGDVVRIRFDDWTPESYDLFLRTKALPEHEVRYDEAADAYEIETAARFAPLLGLQVQTSLATPLPLAEHLWDYQAFFVRIALQARRYAVWADTGLGKTLIEWEWARQVRHLTGGKVLMVYLLNLIPQALAMAREFYGDELQPQVLHTREELIAWCRDGRPGIGVTNPEKFIPRAGEPESIAEISFLAGVCVDESSLLKTGGGVIKWALIKSCRGVEYKLSNTATPAPNDPIEYASQASWLEKIRDEGEVIWTFFTRDAEGEWKIKDHALEAFYQFLSGWSCYLRDPKRYGFADNLLGLPAPERFEHVIPATAEQLAFLARIPNAEGQCSMFEPGSLGIVERTKLGQLASGFLYGPGGSVQHVPSWKPGRVATLIEDEVEKRGLQVLVWTQFDETARIIARQLDLPPPARRVRYETLTGSVPPAERPAMLERFLSGETRALITRPRVLGFGSNLQCCGSMVFADFNDSAEQIYQAERRAYRYGQTRSVRIHFPYVAELQGAVWSNVQAKQAQFARDVARMEDLYINAVRPFLPGAA